MAGVAALGGLQDLVRHLQHAADATGQLQIPLGRLSARAEVAELARGCPSMWRPPFGWAATASDWTVAAPSRSRRPIRACI